MPVDERPQGAKTVICYVSEKEKVDADETIKLVEKARRSGSPTPRLRGSHRLCVIVNSASSRPLPVQEPGKACIAIQGDAGVEGFADMALGKCIESFGRLDILVNNEAEQHQYESISDITENELEARGS